MIHWPAVLIVLLIIVALAINALLLWHWALKRRPLERDDLDGTELSPHYDQPWHQFGKFSGENE